MRRFSLVLAGLLLAVGLRTAHATVPQTINIDGVNDFNPANLVDDDRGDTEIKNWCTDDAIADSTMDIGRVYMTNDAVFLYLGFEYYSDCFGSVQLGLAFDVNNTVAGGTDDPFTRKIGWTSLTNRPDAYIYMEEFGSNYQIFYKWNGSSWADSTSLINPAGSGANALTTQANSTNRFVEMKIPLAALRVNAGQPLNWEVWMTQNGSGKAALDAGSSDNVQMSRATGTTFDTTAVVQMTSMYPYTVLTVIDNAPPTVLNARAVSFALRSTDKTFNTVTNKIDVLYGEPVDQTTAQAPSNYTVSGAAAPSVIAAQRDASNSSLVHLTLGASISANAAFYNVTVKNVKDIAGNAIVQNGTTNVGSFFIQNVTFNGDVHLPLRCFGFAVTDTFAVEGNLSPLDFTVANNARMYDNWTYVPTQPVDSIVTTVVPFCMTKDAGTGKAEADLQWKMTRTPDPVQPYEPRQDNRFIHLSSDSGATVTLNARWGDLDAADYTNKAVDVIFKVNAATPYLPPGRKLWLVGSEAPLSFVAPFNRPGSQMKDDGVAPDAVAGDGIWTLKVRFPACTYDNLRWKVAWDSTATDTVYECPGQGDRTVWINSAAFDTVGGPHGALVLPARGVNRCTVSDKPIKVVFTVNCGNWAPVAGDTVAVQGDHAPLSFTEPAPAAQALLNNGVGFDASPNDTVFTGAFTFPDSTPLNVQYKFWRGTGNAPDPRARGYECFGSDNRNFWLDDLDFSTTKVERVPLAIWNQCANPLLAVDPDAGRELVAFASLAAAVPNPARAIATIRFELRQAGTVSLRIYDVTGRRVAQVIDGPLAAGAHEARWTGRDDGGRPMANGVYFYELSQGGQRISKRMILVQR